MKTRLIPGLIVALAAGGVLAHGGVTNPGVMARMEGMTTLKDSTAVLGQMVKGEQPFDVAAATLAKNALVAEAARIAPLFATPHQDPKSEALSAIWQDWAAFTARSEALLTAAEQLRTDDPGALRASFSGLARACGACHEDYRVKR